MKTLTIASAMMLALISYGYPKDTGEFNDIPPDLRSKFFDAPGIKLCCAEADGHRVNYRGNFEQGYEVEIDGKWHAVSPEKVVTNPKNPTLEGIAWYMHRDGEIEIRCFSPASGV
jgi:hypothetical protein